MKYYTGKDEKDPFYEEYLLNLNDGNRSYLGNISLPNGAAVWRYKENSNRNGTATDVTKIVDELVNGKMYPMGTVPEIELYAGYSVSIDASVSEEDITKDSAIIKGNTAGTTVYYTNKSDYQIYTGEELRNVAKSTEKRSDFTQVKVGEDGTFSIPLTGLDPLKKYTYYLVAENSNMDVSDSRAVTFTTKARVLTAADFQIVGDREFTYENNGATHTVTVKPAEGNEELFDIDFVVYKMKKGEEYTGSYLQPQAGAGTYGIYVTTKPKSGIEQAKYLLIGDMTIKKAKFNPEWFNIVDSITYGTEEYESLKPRIKDKYNGVGGPAVTEYGQIEYKLYNDSKLAQEVLRNSDGHYDSSPDMNQDYATYYMGVTSTGGDNVEPQETPVLVGTQITVMRATNTISITSCPGIRYGETPEPKSEATDTTGGVKYTYSSTANGEYTDWNEKNKPGKWYVKATVGKSQNYNEAESIPVEFEVSKAKLVPSVSAVKS